MAFHTGVALVTGGASGMGQEAALQLEAADATVATVDLNEDALTETAATRDNISAYACDVSDLDAVQSMMQRVESELGAVTRLEHKATE